MQCVHRGAGSRARGSMWRIFQAHFFPVFALKLHLHRDWLCQTVLAPQVDDWHRSSWQRTPDCREFTALRVFHSAKTVETGQGKIWADASVPRSGCTLPWLHHIAITSKNGVVSPRSFFRATRFGIPADDFNASHMKISVRNNCTDLILCDPVPFDGRMHRR